MMKQWSLLAQFIHNFFFFLPEWKLNRISRGKKRKKINIKELCLAFQQFWSNIATQTYYCDEFFIQNPTTESKNVCCIGSTESTGCYTCL